jgi:TetR/AcrR family transcriptional regulator
MSSDQNMEQAILKSATRLFLERGFKATSTTEIAKAAGCNQALVHYYYRTKDRLFEAIFEKKMKFFISSLLQIESEDLPFLEKLAKRIESHFDAIIEDPQLPQFLFTEINSNPKRLEQLREKLSELPAEVFQKIQSEVETEVAAGNIRPISVYDLLLTIVSLNIMVFIAGPMFSAITRISEEDFIKLRERRKKEHVHIIISSLKP